MNLPKLRYLEYSPNTNPLIEPTTIETKRRLVRAARAKDLVDPLTGEVTALSTIHTVEEKDDKEFVKVFASGVQAMYDLSRTAHRVFLAILHEYQNTPMTGGYADCLHLVWFNGGLCGNDIGMSEATFNRGFRELIAKGFLAAKLPTVYWVNPSLFFKGDRVAFIKEYRKKSKPPQIG